jgi:4-alpha-glucanotransferase
VTPAARRATRCTDVAERLGRRPAFGLWVNLYTLRRPAGLGFGDLSALRGVVRLAADAGAAFVGVNPLHALRNRGAEVSPYAPLSRLFRNPLYLDVEAVPEAAEAPGASAGRDDPELRRRIERARAAATLDYEALAELQRELLLPLHAVFARRHRGRDGARGRAFAAFCDERGEALREFATFLALEDHLAARGHPRDWRRWPAGFQSPRAPEVLGFAETHAEEVSYHAWVQFELDRQLCEAAREARERGLALGIYGDLALGSAAGGCDDWSQPGLFRGEYSVGAPPDAYSSLGQDWSFPPLDPERLSGPGLESFRTLLRAAFAHAGALRIDHVMGLVRQFWIPRGRKPVEGAYVRYPAARLSEVLAQESRRSHAVVVGEDLGTLPPGFQSRLARRGILSSRVLLFERGARGSFRPASRYSPRALVTANTHDLPPLAGFLCGRDIELRRELGVLSPEQARAARAERESARAALLRRLACDGLLDRGDPAPAPRRLLAAVNAFLCRTPAPLVGVSLDDLAGEVEPVNVPGVPPDVHPSWTRRMRETPEEILAHPEARRALAALAPRALRPAAAGTLPRSSAP